MNNFEEEVRYFTELVFNNIQQAKKKENGRFEIVFFNINIRLDGKEVFVYNQEKDEVYQILTKDIEDMNFETDVTKQLALYYIDKLTKYNNNIISFEELAGISKEDKPEIKKLINQKNNISEQLRLLRKHRDNSEVQEYIDGIYNDKFTSKYVKYLIDKYYYNKKDLIKPEKNGLEKMHKMLLH